MRPQGRASLQATPEWARAATLSDTPDGLLIEGPRSPDEVSHECVGQRSGGGGRVSRPAHKRGGEDARVVPRVSRRRGVGAAGQRDWRP
jgi:hypothetical protein